MKDLNKILERYTRVAGEPRHAMARGLLVLDENSAGLKTYIEDKNIKTVVVKPREDDPDIQRSYLPHRILVTKNSRHFLEGALIHEYGIIAYDNMTDRPNQDLADIISKAIIEHRLWSRAKPWICVLNKNGRHRFRELVG